MTDAFDDPRVPVTLLTGFLGAGKTTLLNHLIRDPQAGRIAVIMNEFGDVGLDHDLIEESTDETVLMPSGCLCCTIRGDLSRTMCSLIARRKRGELSFDRVVIETTGIADPGPILHSMVMDHLIARYYRTDGVVTLADAANGARTLDSQFEAVNQVAMADLLVLSKTDLVTPAQLAAFETRLKAINSAARLMRADHGRVAPGALFGLSAMRGAVTARDVDDWLGAPDPLAGLSGMAVQPKAAMPLPGVGAPAGHDHRIVSASITLDQPIPEAVFDVWLDTLVAHRGQNLLRVKGIVHIQGLTCPYVFHGVQQVFDAPVPMKNWDKSDSSSRVVIIARDMSETELTASLEQLRLHAGPILGAAPVAG